MNFIFYQNYALPGQPHNPLGISLSLSDSFCCKRYFIGRYYSPSLGIWPGEGFYVPDPCELTFANTLLLSNAAISLGNAFISLEISCSLLIIGRHLFFLILFYNNYDFIY